MIEKYMLVSFTNCENNLSVTNEEEGIHRDLSKNVVSELNSPTIV